MKNLSFLRNLCVFSLTAFCFALLSTTAKAQFVVVNYDFATASVTATSPCTVTPKSVAGNVTATLTTSTGNCTTFATGRATVTPPAFVVNAANQAISINNAVTQQYYQFQLSGAGLSTASNYMVFFQTSRSNTGPPNGVLQYSTDGINFTDFMTFTVPTAFDDGIAFDLSGITALNNQTNIYFRIAASGASGTAGTFRIDNFQVQAQAQAQATTFSGEAVGVIANANIGNIVTADARVADTGPLPSTGGTQQGDVANASVALDADPSLNSRIDTGIIETRTSGGAAAGTPNSSQSRATVNDLNVKLLANIIGTGATITATTVESTSNCTCGSNGPTCSGTTTIENLQVNGVVIPILDATGMVTSMPPPNTVLLPGITGVVGLTITLNEQTSTGSGDITVNAIHIVFRDPITNAVTADIIVAQSHSDIQCLGTTAAGATINGRITDSRGRGLQRVVVMMTGSGIEEPIYATTSAFGFYRFEDVPAGNTYILTASSVRYIFERSSIVINVGGDFAGADFVGQRRFSTVTDSIKTVKQP